MMLNSIDNGPLVYPTIEEDRQTRPKKYSKLIKAQQLQDDCDVQATNIILHDLPSDVYVLVNHQDATKDIWDKVKLLMKGTKLSYQERECRFYKLFDKFASVQGETLYEYYWRFSHLINDMHTIGMTMQQTTIQDGRVTVQQIQGRQTQSFAGTGNRGISTTSKGNYTASQPKVVKCYNCMGEGHTEKQCTQPKRPRSSAWFKEKLMLAEAQEAGQILDEEQLAFIVDPGIAEVQVAQQTIPQNLTFQTEDLDAYDSNCDDISSAKAVLMAYLSRCDSDVLSEVPYSNTYLNDMINQDVQEKPYSEQTHIVDFLDNEITNDNNIISYSQYPHESQNVGIQGTNSSAPNDLLVLSLVEQMSDHISNLYKENQTNKMVNESLTAKLERYKERVSIFEQRLNVDLNKREKLIDSQMDDLIRNRNAKFTAFQQEIDTLDETLSNQVKEKKSLSTTLTVFKTECKEKESKYMDKEIVLENKNKELENTLSQSQGKDTIIRKLKDRIKPVHGKDSVENVKKDIDEIETINIELEHCLNAQLQEKVFAIATLKNELRKLKGKNFVDTAVSKPSTTIAPGMFKLDIEPISHRLKNNIEAHEVYVENTIENTDTLCGLVKYARKQNPSEPLLKSACMFTKHIQELLVHVSKTCPSLTKPTEKLVVVTPMNKDKKVRFAEPVMSSKNIPKQTDSLRTNNSNKPLLTSTGVNTTTSASGSKPSGNTKKNRISRPPSSNLKNKIKEHPRKVESCLNKTNSIFEPISNAHVKHYVRNAKFESICAICNKCLFDANHDIRKPKAARSVGSSRKSKIVESKTSNTKEPKQSRGSTISDVPSSSLNDCRLPKLLCGYGDYQMGNITISWVYYVEELGHNLFSVGQFCDSNLEVAFRKHTCFIRDLEGVDLLKGSRGSNLYTLSMDNLLLSSPIYLLSKASKTKSLLWHRRLSHLNFDYITSLAKQGLVQGILKLKYQKDHLCFACALGKSKKHSHKPNAEEFIREKLYLLHMDRYGLMRIQIING
ncbi:retrovirus-related pol polyprotein from transposon TNT 1-94 [Tanacetum coccineum]